MSKKRKNIVLKSIGLRVRLIDFILEQLAEPEAFIAKVTELYQKPEEACPEYRYYNMV